MINAFRKIRKKLADNNKPIKYFRYAIGEVILVVIGILIALSINNWNEERKTNYKSQVYINKIVNDLITDTININTLIKNSKVYKSNTLKYFSFFNQGNMPIDKLIDSSRNVSAGYLRYIPVDHTFLDMQSSGNSNLLNDNQRDALIELSSIQEQLQIIIEKVISNGLNEGNESNKYLGYPDDFFDKIGIPESEDNKLQWLIHRHLRFNWNLQLYDYIERRGNRIKEQSKKTILILNDESKP